jgi:type IX secretion system PorP/SprF family membrane protein
MINPAYAGSQEYSVLSTYVYQHNYKVQGAPKTFVLSFHSPIKLISKSSRRPATYKQLIEVNKVGVGGMIYYDVNGPLNTLSLQMTYSYKIALNQSGSTNISFAISGNISSISVNTKYFNVTSDPVLEQIDKAKFAPNLAAGVLFNLNKYYIGASLMNIINQPVAFTTGSFNELEINRALSIHTGYRYYFNHYVLEPSINSEIILSKENNKFSKYIFTLKSEYKILTLGVSYRLNTAYSGFVALAVDSYDFGVGYTFYNKQPIAGLNSIEVFGKFRFNHVKVYSRSKYR